MKQYRVQITDSALQDMEMIYIYIAEQLLAPDYAMGQYDRIAEAIESLQIFPERVRLMDSAPERSLGLRRMTVDIYSVFYSVSDGIVKVVRVLYSASDIEKRLLDL